MRGPQKLQRKHGARPYLRTGRRCPLPLKTLPRSHHPRTGCDAGGRRRREFPAAGRNEHTGYQLLRRGVPRLDPGPLRLDLRRPRPSQRRRAQAGAAGGLFARHTEAATGTPSHRPEPLRQELPAVRRRRNIPALRSLPHGSGVPARRCKEVVVYTDGTGPLLTAVALELGEFSCTPAEARATPCDKPFDPAAYRWLLIPDVALQKARLTPTYLQGHADIWSPNGYGFAAEKSEDTLGRWLEIERIEPYNPKQLKRELSGSRLTILKQDFPLTAAEIAARLGIREGGERRIAFTKLGQDYWTIRLK